MQQASSDTPTSIRVEGCFDPHTRRCDVRYVIEQGTECQTPRRAERERRVVRRKRMMLTAIKCVVSGALIYWIMQDTNLSEILLALHSVHIPLLLLAFSSNAVGYFIIAQRWRVLLNVQGVDVSLPFLITSYMVAMFFNNFLPSTIGGDVVRAYDSWRWGKSKAGAVAVVFMDRFLGILVLMLFVLSAVLISNNQTLNLPFIHLWTLSGVIGMLFVVWMIFVPSRQAVAFIEKVRLPFSGKLQGVVRNSINAFLAFQGRKDALGKALGLSLLLQTNVVLHYYLIARGLGFHIPLGEFFLIVPLSLFIMMIPVSINAIGLRENAFAFFFATFGVMKPEAVAFAWLAYGMVALQGLIGGIVYAIRR